jgi:tetratricopeptide (TPR) repeat protein
MNDGDVVDAAEFAIRNLELLKPHREFPLLAIWISEKLMEAGDTDRGLMFLRWAAEGDQSNLAVVNNLAWQLAANPSDRVRNPELALKWAEKANAMTGGKHPAILDTLAVALAATGDFGKAIMVVEQGIKLSNESEAAPMRERLALFQKGQPYREPLPVKK